MGNSGSAENDFNAAGGTAQDDFGAQAADAASMLAGGSGNLHSKLQLSISCSDLQDVDVGSLSDPFCVVKTRSSKEEQWNEIARTEIIANTLDPHWVSLVPITFYFEKVQYLRFEVYDVRGAFSSNDPSNLPLLAADLLGYAETALALVTGGQGQQWEAAMVVDVAHREGKGAQGQRASIKVKAEEAATSNLFVNLKLSAVQIKSKYNRPFLRICRIGEGGHVTPCYRTEVSNNRSTAHPVLFRPVDAPLATLANGDPYRPLLVQAFSYKEEGTHKYLGSCKLSIKDMEAAVEGRRVIPLINEAKKADRGDKYTDSGGLKVEAVEVRKEPSFLDYLAGGVNMAFSVAIDYTASNGDPRDPSSLHYLDPSRRKNEYQQAIESVGSVVEFFDDDKLFPVYGFGGICDQGGAAQHCFAVTGQEAHPEVLGVEGVLSAYSASLTRVRLSGPTLFAPVINQACALVASQGPSSMDYTVLLILTDGLICDMANTKDAIVAAADLPFSIIIVGVGKEDFSNMEELDGDDVRLKNQHGKFASRDIVQFVPFQEFTSKGPMALAEEVLAEIPAQVVQYYQQHNVAPRSPKVKGSSMRDLLQTKHESFRQSQRLLGGDSQPQGGGDGGLTQQGDRRGSGSGAIRPPPPSYNASFRNPPSAPPL